MPVRLEDIRLPPELAKFQYANFFESDWKFQLARAVSYKLTQIEEAEPEQLAAFLKTGQSSESSKKLKSFEESTDVLNCSAEYFTYEKEGIYWDYVNACIVSNVFRGIFDARAEFTGLSETIELKNEWSVNVEEFYRSDELVSLRFFVDWYGSGAAHPNHHAYTMNFVGPVLSQLTLERLFDHSTDVANLLIRYCDHDLKRQHASPDGEIEFLSFPKTAQEAFETFAAFNFDEDGITINLSPYAVLSYAAGFQEVRVPWSSVSAFVSHALRDGPLERLVKRLASDW